MTTKLATVRAAVELAEKHDLAMLEIPGVVKLIRRERVPERRPPTPEERLAREQEDAKKRAQQMGNRTGKVKKALDEFEGGGL